MFWPERDFGFVIMTNIAGTAADEALRKLAAKLYKAFFQYTPQSGASGLAGEYWGNQRLLADPE
jgi:hypothetical protein